MCLILVLYSIYYSSVCYYISKVVSTYPISYVSISIYSILLLYNFFMYLIIKDNERKIKQNRLIIQRSVFLDAF